MIPRCFCTALIVTFISENSPYIGTKIFKKKGLVRNKNNWSSDGPMKRNEKMAEIYITYSITTTQAETCWKKSLLKSLPVKLLKTFINVPLISINSIFLMIPQFKYGKQNMSNSSRECYPRASNIKLQRVFLNVC